MTSNDPKTENKEMLDNIDENKINNHDDNKLDEQYIYSYTDNNGYTIFQFEKTLDGVKNKKVFTKLEVALQFKDSFITNL
jgi:Zn-dependent metalloprotease